MKLALATLLCLGAAPARAEAPSLALPVDCTLGQTCFIQNYVDRDPGPGAKDFTCGPQSYDGHKGTDFALLSLTQMQQGVDVRPALPGRVLGIRDGMADEIYDGSVDLNGRDCGNGVLIEHDDGYRTQYCHMKNGSIRVANGQTVTEATVLGQVGLSGRTQFPHLHLTLRHDGDTVDPFHPGDTATCATTTDTALWRAPLDYSPGGLIAAGFAPDVPAYDDIKAGTAAAQQIAPDAGALVLWAYAFGARAGDVMAFSFSGPDGLDFSGEATLERTQAQLFRAQGKRRRAAPWPVGQVTGTIRLMRNGTEIDQIRATVAIAR